MESTIRNSSFCSSCSRSNSARVGISEAETSFTCEWPFSPLIRGSTKIISSPSLAMARVSPKHAVPSPPLMKGGNSQPNIKGRIFYPVYEMFRSAHNCKLSRRPGSLKLSRNSDGFLLNSIVPLICWAKNMISRALMLCDSRKSISGLK